MSEHQSNTPETDGQPKAPTPESAQEAAPEPAVEPATNPATEPAGDLEGEPPIPSATKDTATAAAPDGDGGVVGAGTGDGPDRVAELEAQAADLNDKLLRALAEAENVRRRAERDKQDAAKYAIAGFAREMLDVADNLRRALDAVDADARKGNEVVENILSGIEITERGMFATFERTGIRRIDPLGQRFDTNLHEAMYEIPDESQPAGTVAQVVESGYLLNDRLLRPAKVGITKGGPKAVAGTASEAGAEPGGAAQKGAQAGAPGSAPGSDGQKAYEQDAGAAGGQLDEEL